jgi:uncharacterized damage-inducible protein DinB
MATTTTSAAGASTGAARTPKQQFLDAYHQEHDKTMRVLKAFPADKAELRPHERCKTARELAWIFALERRLGTTVLNDELAAGRPPGKPPAPPESWDAVLAAVERTHKEFGDLVRSMPDARLGETVKFFVGPKTMGDVRRTDFLWFLLHDQIHHRGQFSIYLRMADAKVPSIYGPSGDEPWS